MSCPLRLLLARTVSPTLGDLDNGGLTGQVFVGGLGDDSSTAFCHDETGLVGLGEEEHRGDVPF